MRVSVLQQIKINYQDLADLKHQKAWFGQVLYCDENDVYVMLVARLGLIDKML